MTAQQLDDIPENESTSGDPSSRVGSEIRPWRLGLLAGMASFLDAGTIVAVSYALATWEEQFSLSPWQLGGISAALTVCIGIGSVVGGRLGDRVGRKRIYTIDLLVFAAGLVILIFATGPGMLVAGVVVAGLAMGADIPTSLALVGEMAPPDRRGTILSFGWLLWVAGILFVTILVAAVGEVVGDGLPRVLFGGLLVAAAVTWALRTGIKESQVWIETKSSVRTAERSTGRRRSPWTRQVVLGLLFTASFYLFLTLGTNFLGAYNAYILATVAGLRTQVVALLGLIGIVVATVCIMLVMRLIDTRARAPMFYIGASLMIIAWVPPIVTNGSVWALLVGLLVYNAGSMFAGEMHWRVWAQELAPTMLRGVTQGVSFGVARAASGAFLLVAPMIIASDFRTILWIMLALCVASGVIGSIWMPRTQNLPVDEIDRQLGSSSSGKHDADSTGVSSL